ncbi:PREDICTED: non-functional pseudokinase ZED1-like [Camelina sativa]|uniref:Non-functional pseudokinase ZED1-like n=1 Tax=Camelina sativa TaxID=90675 RepID=A0ABM1RTS8_CAMSA|nr:PREDICTED: non-functional pseudokinase ZED1-like [Camelina sativa]
MLMNDQKMSFWSKKTKKKNLEANQRLRLFQENGKVLLEDLIELCNGKSNPIKTFSANEILEATDNFSESNLVVRFEFMYRGMLQNRPVLIKRAIWNLYKSDTLEKICRDIAVSSMVSGHKNFLKLLGCCLEFEHPVLVCEYAERIPFNTPNPGMFLPWGMRIKIVKEIAIAASYLHTAFSRTMIHTDIQPSNIFLDSNGTAKLSGFCLCVSIPEGETFVKVHADRVEGTLDYLEYNYAATGLITEYTDVFSFGVLLQNFFTSMYGVVDCCCSEDESLFEEFEDKQNVMNMRISDRVSKFVEEGRIFEMLDPNILESIGDDVTEEHKIRLMEAVLTLSLRCTGHRGDVPKMMEAAKELKKIERWTESGFYKI